MTKNRTRWFGSIQSGKVLLSKIGKIAYKYWLEIPNHFKHVKLGAFVVMPDHVHGIMIITDMYGNASFGLQYDNFNNRTDGIAGMNGIAGADGIAGTDRGVGMNGIVGTGGIAGAGGIVGTGGIAGTDGGVGMN